MTMLSAEDTAGEKGKKSTVALDEFGMTGIGSRVHHY